MEIQVAVFGVLRFPPENIEELLPHLRELIEETYKNDGCIQYDVGLDPFDEGLIRFSELWPNRESLENHLQASHIEPWRKLAKSYGLIERKFTSYDILFESIEV